MVGLIKTNRKLSSSVQAASGRLETRDRYFCSLSRTASSARLLRDLELQLVIGAPEFQRSRFHFLFQVAPMAPEFLISGLDLGEHFVKIIDQGAEFVRLLPDGANGIVLPDRNEASGLGKM